MLGMLADTGFPLAQLAGKFIHHPVDRRVEIGFSIFSEDVGSWKGKVDLDHKGFLLILVVEQNDVCGKDLFTVFLKVADFFCNKGMNRAGKGDIAGAQVDLHNYTM